MFDSNTHHGYFAVVRLFFLSQFFLTRLFSVESFYILEFVALKACVHKQRYIFRVSDHFRLGHLLIMGFAWAGLAQIRNPLFLDHGNHYILLTIDFLLASISTKPAFSRLLVSDAIFRYRQLWNLSHLFDLALFA